MEHTNQSISINLLFGHLEPDFFLDRLNNKELRNFSKNKYNFDSILTV